MMDGITVLNVVEHSIKGWGWDNLAIITIILSLVFAAFAYFLWSENVLPLGDICAILSVSLLFLTFAILSNAKVISTYNTYEVTIDDTVSWVELNERYDVISQRGNIIEIKEKDVN